MTSELTILLSLLLFLLVSAKKFDEKNKPDWAKKDIRDYSDADVERLLDQWEVCKLLVLPSMCWFVSVFGCKIAEIIRYCVYSSLSTIVYHLPRLLNEFTVIVPWLIALCL